MTLESIVALATLESIVALPCIKKEEIEHSSFILVLREFYSFDSV